LKVLCFRFYGDFGHFRPYFTTTSPITYSLIPPTSVMGVLGAILGLDKNEYTHVLQKAETRIGVGIVNPIRKKTFGINLINTKDNYWIPTSTNPNGPRTPTRYEFLINPEYLVFVTMADSELLNILASKIEKHETCYSVSMGLAWLLADFKPVAFDHAQKIDDLTKPMEFWSAVPLSLLDPAKGIGIKSGVKYCKERFVKYFGADRKPVEYVDAVFSVSGENAQFLTSEAYRLNDMNFCFLT